MSNNCKLKDKNNTKLFLSHVFILISISFNLLILPYTQSNITLSSLLRLLRLFYSRGGFFTAQQ
jgi:hypothetical protein